MGTLLVKFFLFLFYLLFSPLQMDQNCLKNLVRQVHNFIHFNR